MKIALNVLNLIIQRILHRMFCTDEQLMPSSNIQTICAVTWIVLK